ncbi:MAG: serine dehydratase beta chain, partial [Spirochaetota bacterium]
MESIRSLYRIGSGPSSSHTMAPRKSAIRFYEEFKQAKSFEAL